MTATLPLIDQARARRAELQRIGQRRSLALATSIVLTWIAVVVSTAQLDRVLDNSAAAFTMIFGSFVAGSTPQGGGAVAFPVFTKILGVSATDARTFSLAIQAIGMGSASTIIALTGRAVDRAALRRTVPAAITGFLGGTALFALVTPPAAYLKVVFTLLVVVAGASTWLSRRGAVVEQLQFAPLRSTMARYSIVGIAALGGLASALFGSGADVAVYLLLTIVLGVRPSIGVATSVVTMASVSIVGLILALSTGQLSSASSALADYDLFGMWLAAIPVVVIGAPLGSWFAQRVTAETLTRFIGVLASLELVSTALFLDELRTNPALAAFAVIGLAMSLIGVRQIVALREHLATTRQPLSGSVRRLDLEMEFTQ